jgi:hypothetical protein
MQYHGHSISMVNSIPEIMQDARRLQSLFNLPRTCTMRAATGGTGNTRDSAACSPGLCCCLVSSLGGNSVRLALVLCHVSVHRLDDVRTDGCGEYRRQLNLHDQTKAI